MISIFLGKYNILDKNHLYDYLIVNKHNNKKVKVIKTFLYRFNSLNFLYKFNIKIRNIPWSNFI